jgi:sugar phosphate isomerase/epimerase
MMNRREFGKFALAAVPAAGALAETQLPSEFNGVRLGIGSYSFRGLTLDDIVKGLATVPFGALELEAVFVEPGVAAAGRTPLSPEQRETLRQWRLGPSLEDLSAVKKRFDDAGIHVYAYNIPVDDSFTGPEMDRIFPMAQALGAGLVNVVTTLPVAERLIEPSAKYKMRVGFHPTGGRPTPDSIGTGESWRKVAALAPNFGICPDLGQRANWGADPLVFIREMHDRITTLHTHDTVPFGEGSAPVKEILLMVKSEKYAFVPTLERIYQLKPGADNVVELRNLVDYCKKVLAG